MFSHRALLFTAGPVTLHFFDSVFESTPPHPTTVRIRIPTCCPPQSVPPRTFLQPRHAQHLPLSTELYPLSSYARAAAWHHSSPCHIRSQNPNPPSISLHPRLPAALHHNRPCHEQSQDPGSARRGRCPEDNPNWALSLFPASDLHRSLRICLLVCLRLAQGERGGVNWGAGVPILLGRSSSQGVCSVMQSPCTPLLVRR